MIFLSGDLALGGGAIFILNLCNGLRSAGKWNPVAGVISSIGVVGRQLLDSNHRLVGPFPEAVIHEDYMEALYSACREVRPAAIVANLGGESFDFLRFVPPGVLRVGMIHGDDENVYNLVERYLPWLDLIVGVSRENCRKMSMRVGERKIPVVQVACGVPMPSPAHDNSPANGMRILYLGRVVELQKRAGLLSRIIARTLDADASVKWTIAGDGPDMPGMMEQFKAQGERVEFTGPVSYTEVPDLLRRHDVYFLCSDFEGLPLSMLEAMGAGLVPVVSDLASGISEVVNDENGIRIPPHDEDSYVHALLELAGNPERLKRLRGQASLDVRKEYSVEAMAGRWNNLLDIHVNPSAVEWPETCVADSPPELQHKWRYHPLLRGMRKWMKSILSTPE